jgi:hypothetical protein
MKTLLLEAAMISEVVSYGLGLIRTCMEYMNESRIRAYILRILLKQNWTQQSTSICLLTCKRHVLPWFSIVKKGAMV